MAANETLKNIIKGGLVLGILAVLAGASYYVFKGTATIGDVKPASLTLDKAGFVGKGEALTEGYSSGSSPSSTVYQSSTLTATISPANAVDLTVLWSSSDESAVTLAKAKTISGEVNAIQMVKPFTGTVYVYATSRYNSAIKSTCVVTNYNELATWSFTDWDGINVASYDSSGNVSDQSAAILYNTKYHFNAGTAYTGTITSEDGLGGYAKADFDNRTFAWDCGEAVTKPDGSTVRPFVSMSFSLQFYPLYSTIVPSCTSSPAIGSFAASSGVSPSVESSGSSPDGYLTTYVVTDASKFGSLVAPGKDPSKKMLNFAIPAGQSPELVGPVILRTYSDVGFGLGGGTEATKTARYGCSVNFTVKFTPSVSEPTGLTINVGEVSIPWSFSRAVGVSSSNASSSAAEF